MGMQQFCSWALFRCGLFRNADDSDDDDDDDDSGRSGAKASTHKHVRCVGHIGLIRLVVQLLCWLGRAWCGPPPTGLPWVAPPLLLELPDLPPHTPPAPYSPLAVFLGALPPAACDALLRFSTTLALAVCAMASLQVFVWRASALARVERRVNTWADDVLAFGERWWCEGVVEHLGLPNQVLGVSISLGNQNLDDDGNGSTVSPCATWFFVTLLLLLGPRLLRYVMWPLTRLVLLQPIQHVLIRLLRGPSPASVRTEELRFQTAVAAAELAAMAKLGVSVGHLVSNYGGFNTNTSSSMTATSRLADRQSANANNDDSNDAHSERPVFLPFAQDGSLDVTI